MGAMDLRRLRTFVAVADLGTISAAAVALRTAQPALSRQLQDLQAEFGVALFEQVGRRLRLTAEGAELLPACRALLEGSSALIDRARALVEGDRGELRVGATPHTIASVFPGFLREFAKAHPHVRIRPIEAGGVTQVEMLRRGELHVAVGSHDAEDAELIVHGLSSVPVILVFDPDAVANLPARPEMRDLIGRPLLLLGQGYGTRKMFDAACRLARVAPDVAMESASGETLLALARAGQGIAVLSASTRIDRRGLRIATLRLRGRVLASHFAVMWHRTRRLPSYASTFSTLMSRHCDAAIRRTIAYAG
jgi:DNA-binding transcriptional LysR family regulator